MDTTTRSCVRTVGALRRTPRRTPTWWSDTWAERLSRSDFAHQALERGLSDSAELAQLAQGWLRWGELSGAWFAVLHGEILCRR
jgi:hypothetical protein